MRKTQAAGRWVPILGGKATLANNLGEAIRKVPQSAGKMGPGESQEQTGSRSLLSLPPDTRHMFTSARLRGARKAEKEIYWF